MTERLYYSDSFLYDFDAQVVEAEHPDIVIQEIVGRHLYGFVPSPELVPDK